MSRRFDATSALQLAISEDLNGPTLQRYRDLAKEMGLWLSLGGFQVTNSRRTVHDRHMRQNNDRFSQHSRRAVSISHILSPHSFYHLLYDSCLLQEKGPDDRHLFNTHVVVNALGNVVACYRKIHLFTFEDPDNDVHLDEGSFTKAGDQVVCCESDVGRLGLTVCYDLRFPHIYQMLRFDQHADVLLVCPSLVSVLSVDALSQVPSAFTVPTGKAHWEVLLRARAIETQCYVIAAAQTNRHNDRRESYGHTMAINPWGASHIVPISITLSLRRGLVRFGNRGQRDWCFGNRSQRTKTKEDIYASPPASRSFLANPLRKKGKDIQARILTEK